MGRKDVNAFYIPIKRLKAIAMAFEDTMTVVYGQKKLDRAVLWHECGHLSKNNEGKSIFVEFSESFCEKGSGESVSSFLKKKSRWHIEKYIKEEVRAQIWAIKMAMSKGYINIAKEIYYLLDPYDDVYRVAHNRMVRKLKKEGIEF